MTAANQPWHDDPWMETWLRLARHAALLLACVWSVSAQSDFTGPALMISDGCISIPNPKLRLVSSQPLRSNYFFGGDSGNLTMTGGGNTAVGSRALASNSVGCDMTAVGSDALRFLVSGTGNTAMGRLSQERNVKGVNNTSVGDSALRFNVGDGNTALGYLSLTSTSSGTDNVGVGRGAGVSLETGSNNTIVGSAAMSQSTNGNFNTAVGQRSLYANRGSENTGVGYLTLFNAKQSANTAVGAYAGFNLTTGLHNTFVGQSAGNHALQKVDAVSSTAIGDGAYTTKNYQVAIGGDKVEETVIKGANVLTTGTLKPAKLDVERFWLLDVTDGSMKQVVLGDRDSGGTGFKILRVANE